MSNNEKRRRANQKADQNLDDLLVRFHGLLQGAEDEESEEEESEDGSDDSDDSSEEDEQDSDSDDDDGDTFSRSYVEKLRQEAAANRKKAKDAEAKLQKQDRAKLDAKERAELEKADAQKERDDALAELRAAKLESALLAEAGKKNFHDAADVIGLIKVTDLDVGEDGLPLPESIKKAVADLAKNKPHLIKTKSSGSGDGGSHGKGAVNQNEVQTKVTKEFQDKGMVPIP